jgi:hypothetical protein
LPRRDAGQASSGERKDFVKIEFCVRAQLLASSRFELQNFAFCLRKVDVAALATRVCFGENAKEINPSKSSLL